MIKVKVNKTKIIDAEPGKAFYVCDGQVLKNLRELAQSLKKMSDKVFNYHVNKEKNDFADWVKNVFGEKDLADGLRKTGTAKAAAKKVGARI